MILHIMLTLQMSILVFPSCFGRLAVVLEILSVSQSALTSVNTRSTLQKGEAQLYLRVASTLYYVLLDQHSAKEPHLHGPMSDITLFYSILCKEYRISRE